MPLNADMNSEPAKPHFSLDREAIEYRQSGRRFYFKFATTPASKPEPTWDFHQWLQNQKCVTIDWDHFGGGVDS